MIGFTKLEMRLPLSSSSLSYGRFSVSRGRLERQRGRREHPTVRRQRGPDPDPVRQRTERDWTDQKTDVAEGSVRLERRRADLLGGHVRGVRGGRRAHERVRARPRE